jgi:carbon-monoxide dehydrogenase medium subunit
MHDFKHHRATDTTDAINALNNADDGKYLAGGQTLIPVMKQGLAMPSDMIDLGGIPDFKGISVDGEAVSIGAITTHAEVAASDDVRRAIPALAGLAGKIGDPHIRNRGTLGGSIANADPAADYPAALVGLGATVKTDRREIAADDFFTDLFETALEEDELITGVDFPIADAAAYVKFTNQASRFALVGVFIARRGDAVRVAVTGAGPSVFRVEEMERALTGNFTANALVGISVAADGLNTDLHAGAVYRAHLINVLARRAVTEIG